MEVTDSAITVFMCLVAGLYFEAWQHVSDSCSVCFQMTEALLWLLCTCMLRRALWGAKLYWDTEEAESWSDSILWDSIPRGGHSATYTDTQQRISNYILIVLANIMQRFPFFFFYTYSLALWRHVVCSWPGPLPPSASALSLAEVRKTVLMPKKLNSFGWIFSLFVSAQKWSRNSSLFCKFYMPNNPQGDLEGWSAAKKQPRCCDFPPRPSALWSNSDQCSSEFLLLKKMAESHLSSSLFIFWHTELCDTLTYCSLLLL